MAPQNPRGKDIQADVDFPNLQGKLSTKSFADCLDACVKYSPLCYGSDVTPYLGDGSTNCWLKDRPFAASSAEEQTVVVDSAMLDLNSLPVLSNDYDSLSPQTSTDGSVYAIQCGLDLAGGSLLSLPAKSMSDCLSLCDQTDYCEAVAYESSYNNGLYNCYLKNANHGDAYSRSYTTVNAAVKRSAVATSTARNSMSSTITSTSKSQPPASSSALAAPSTGLPTGTKAGIGVGAESAALVTILLASWYVMKRRKSRNFGADLPPVTLSPTELDSRPPFARSELEGLVPSIKGNNSNPPARLTELN